jgi:ankyrin repeat protein
MAKSFFSGSVYEGDSFGYHSYIDVDEKRSCTPHCFCRQPEESNAFTFMVYKSPTEIDVNIFSDSLYLEVIGLLGLEGLQIGVVDQERILNGLVLLKNYHNLECHLGVLHSKLPPNQTTHSLVLEMELLVDGLLADGEVFKSFGYEDMYERGFLDFKLWKKFQQQKLERDISALEEGFYAIDDDTKEWSTPPTNTESTTLRSPQAESIIDTAGSVHDAATGFGELPGSPVICDFTLQLPEVEPASVDVGDFWELPTPAHLPSLQQSIGGVGEQLAEAAKAGHEEVVRLLLDRGAAVDGIEVYRRYMGNRRDVPLVEAAKAGHEEVVRLLLDRGAAVDGIEVSNGYMGNSRDVPLVEAAKAGHEEVVRLLLNRGASVEGIVVSNGYMAVRRVPLVEAAGAEHEAVVQLLLDTYVSNQFGVLRSHPLFAEAAEARYKAIERLLADPLDSRLVTAAIDGRISEVRRLLEEGVDINAMTSRGTALSAAARVGHDCIVRLLVRHGADVETAALILQGLGDAEHTMRRLRKVASWVRNGKYTGTMGRPHHYNSEREQKLRYLHRKFVDQHRSMIKASEGSSTEFRELSERFRDYREAWAAGIRTMRGLCSGESPGNAGDTIAFLCLASALSETLRKTGACDCSEQFLQDLGRWQVLFDSKADLDAYRDAIHSMWGLALDENGSYPGQADTLEALTRFQALASTLISRASESLGLDALGDTGLECSQQRWRMRNEQVLSKPDLSDNIPNLHLSSAAQLSESTHPQPLDPAIRFNKSSLREEIETDIASASISHVVVLLMAGAIFGIVVLFLQCSLLLAI